MASTWYLDSGGKDNNAKFIAAAREDVPFLLDEIDRLKKELGILQGEISEMRETFRNVANANPIMRSEIIFLQAENTALRRERDASTLDIESCLLISGKRGMCEFCFYGGNCNKDMECEDQVRWRGPQEENHND